jgi:hypothetical protein
MVEYFVLLDPAGNPLQLFRSMLEVLTWKTKLRFFEDPIIHRIHQKPDGSIGVQIIRVGKENFIAEHGVLFRESVPDT